MRWLVILLILSLAGCATKMGKDGRTQTTVDAKYLAKTEVDRIADTVRSEVVDGLMLIADKLYKRNPREWKKAGVASWSTAHPTVVFRRANRCRSSASGCMRRWHPVWNYRPVADRCW